MPIEHQQTTEALSPRDFDPEQLPDEEEPRESTSRPNSPSKSSRAPLLASGSRRSPVTSPSKQSLVVSAIVAILVMLPAAVTASSGDRHPYFLSCVDECVNERCNPNGPSLGPVLSTLQWTCPDDCAYRCSHTVTTYLLEEDGKMHQFYGKWPFWRFMGCQEPASALFSMGNAWVHWKAFKAIKARFKTGTAMGLKYWVMGLAIIQMNTWFWSTVFHTRGEMSCIAVCHDPTLTTIPFRHPIHRKNGLLFGWCDHHVYLSLIHI